MMTSILQTTALVNGRLLWSPEEAEAFELLTGTAAPATPAEALDLLRALPQPRRNGELAVDVLAAADAHARSAFIRELEALQLAC